MVTPPTSAGDGPAEEPAGWTDGPPRWAGPVVGLTALLVGLGVAELVAGLVRSWRSPVLDVGDRVVDGAPGWVAKAAIDLFGTADNFQRPGPDVVVARDGDHQRSTVLARSDPGFRAFHPRRQSCGRYTDGPGHAATS